MAARQPPGPLHCSISFSALLELQPVPGGGDPSLGLLPLIRHQHNCFWPCLALALRPLSACCTALRLPHSCRNCRCSCTAQVSVRGGLGVNAFRQLHLNIKSNLPPPFCSGAVAERDELCQCAPGEGKGADEAHWVAWEQAGMVQGADLSMTCTFSEDAGRERGQPETSPRATHISAFEQAVQAGLQ